MYEWHAVCRQEITVSSLLLLRGQEIAISSVSSGLYAACCENIVFRLLRSDKMPY